MRIHYLFQLSIRARGLLVYSFSGISITGYGIHIAYLQSGRTSGRAYVELASREDMDNALSRNRQHMDSRFIEGLYYSLVML